MRNRNVNTMIGNKDEFFYSQSGLHNIIHFRNFRMNDFIPRNQLYITLPIYLKSGKKLYTIIDLVHYQILRYWELSIAKHGYATVCFPIFPKPIFIHRLVRKCGPGMEIDHMDGWKLNNRLYNLRAVSKLQNKKNRYPYNKVV